MTIVCMVLSRAPVGARPLLVAAALALSGGALAVTGAQPALAHGTHRPLAGEVPAPVRDGAARATRRRPAALAMHLIVDLKPRDPAALERAVAEASTPGSPRYGHYLSPAEYRARYAPTRATVRAVRSWLTDAGLSVRGSSGDRLLVYAGGTTAQVEAAFGVRVNTYQLGGRTFFAAEHAPSIPASAAVAHISGLNNYVVPRPDVECYPPEEEEQECGYAGPELEKSYEIKGSGEGETVGFVLWGKPQPAEVYDDYATATDTTALKLGAGPGALEFVEVGGKSKETSAGIEIGLDTETVHALAPKAHEKYWLARTSELVEESLNAAAEAKVSIVSNSWGALSCEPEEWVGVEAILEKAAAEGKTFLFASGDEGAAKGCSMPSSSPYGLSVGGTELETTESGEWKAESALDDGGACTNEIPRPAWQTGVSSARVYPKGACSGRATPDVAADSCYSGEKEAKHCYGLLSVWSEGAGAFIGDVGGTSLATPIWAAAAAVWDQRNAAEGRSAIGFVPPLIYTVASDPVSYADDFHDITKGSNGFAATAGWDEATGWGSPKLDALADNPTEISYTGATSGAERRKAKLAARLVNSGTTQGVPGVAVELAVEASKTDTCTATTDASGEASCEAKVTSAAASAKATATFAGDAAYVAAKAEQAFTIEAGEQVKATTPPEITGSAVELSTLTVTPASWSEPIEEPRYQWQLCSAAGSECEPISGATGATYALTHAAVGHTLRVREGAFDEDEEVGSETSAPSAEVTVPPPPVASEAPKITGSPVENRTLHVTSAKWSEGAGGFTYQWLLCNETGEECSAVSGATGTSYKLAAADKGKTLRVEESAFVGVSEGTSTSEHSAEIAAAPTATSPPEISGDAVELSTLTVAPAKWSEAVEETRYQWQLCSAAGSECAPISGASGATLRLSHPDVGHTLVVHEAAFDEGEEVTSADSAPSSLVTVPPAPVAGAQPTIGGSAVEGQTLTATPASWPEGVGGFLYQWLLCAPDGAECNPIAGATGSSYTLTLADTGNTVRVRESAFLGVSEGTSTSDQSAVVRPAPATIAADLLKALAQDGKARRASVRRHGYSLLATAPASGSVKLVWYYVPRGAHIARATPTRVAEGSIRLGAAGSSHLKIKLTRKGAALLKRERRVKLTGVATFAGNGISTVTESRSFALH